MLHRGRDEAVVKQRVIEIEQDRLRSVHMTSLGVSGQPIPCGYPCSARALSDAHGLVHHAGGMTTPVDRPSARAIVIDETGSVLLFRIEDPLDSKPPIWITPGGGINS